MSVTNERTWTERWNEKERQRVRKEQTRPASSGAFPTHFPNPAFVLSLPSLFPFLLLLSLSLPCLAARCLYLLESCKSMSWACYISLAVFWQSCPTTIIGIFEQASIGSSECSCEYLCSSELLVRWPGTSAQTVQRNILWDALYLRSGSVFLPKPFFPSTSATPRRLLQVLPASFLTQPTSHLRLSQAPPIVFSP